MGHLTGGDVRNAQELIAIADKAKAPAQFAEAVVETLSRLIPGEVVGYNERELSSRQLRVAAETPSGVGSREIAAAVSEFCRDYPLSMQRNYAETRAVKISDFLSQRRLHRLNYYNYALRPLAIEHQSGSGCQVHAASLGTSTSAAGKRLATFLSETATSSSS